MVSNMEKVSFNGVMAKYMKENSVRVELMDKASYIKTKPINLKENFKITKNLNQEK